MLTVLVGAPVLRSMRLIARCSAVSMLTDGLPFRPASNLFCFAVREEAVSSVPARSQKHSDKSAGKRRRRQVTLAKAQS